jgi:hypothetical protein
VELSAGNDQTQLSIVSVRSDGSIVGLPAYVPAHFHQLRVVAVAAWVYRGT